MADGPGPPAARTGAGLPPPGRGPVCVQVAVKDDPRLLAALDSLAAQRRRPDRVLIAASTDTPAALADEAVARQPALRVELVRFPGRLVEARSAALRRIDEPTTVFLDSDEVAPAEWLERLVAPIETGTAEFTGGPTRPLRPPANPIERYYDLLEASIYADLVPQNLAYLPLQNTAWRTEVLRRFDFDPGVIAEAAEDHDLETRVLRAGHRGAFVPEAWVFHDKSLEASYVHWARKRYRYLYQMALSLLKNGEMGARWREKRRRVPHPLSYVESLMKPVAYVHARLSWSRVRGSAPAG